MANSQMATCSAELWTLNSKNQSPCLVGSALAGVCVGGDFTLSALEEGFIYRGPSVAVANACRCSSVYYSMLSACAACQGRNFIRWSQYATNCSTTYLTIYPQPIPATVAVPHWAYLDVAIDDTFNITRAQSAGGVESTLVPTAASTTSPGATGGVSGPGAPQSSSSSGGSNAGAIAGGVVGGIVFLALVGLGVFFFLRRRKARQVPASAAYTAAPYNNPSSPPPMSSYGDGTSTYAAIPTPKPYDPQDPSTFPNSSAPLSYSPGPNNGQPAYNGQPNYGNSYGQQNPNYIPPAFTGQSQTSGYTQANTSITTQTQNPSRYTGAPEL
ncbi:hypothetical protein EST38_g3514 [Candolleomyces aberdarensis]|uniref:Epidermal growth factor receptor-like transmembrane-juxtamembrane segment domain-containing protein n=1 Tax=Candolleomyces aberdarensis TaxID=2316362 RepID=A0A4Q2DTB0_9AGAR|nr:hypothetical protein EST38_g3514 [Candolleomyces aberdarensis]